MFLYASQPSRIENYSSFFSANVLYILHECSVKKCCSVWCLSILLSGNTYGLYMYKYRLNLHLQELVGLLWRWCAGGSGGRNGEGEHLNCFWYDLFYYV